MQCSAVQCSAVQCSAVQSGSIALGVCCCTLTESWLAAVMN